jgi:hypothetical protein
METIETYRKFLNKQQTELRRIMMRFDQHDKAIELFLNQHAMLHSAKMAQTELWSFEDAVLNDMTEAQFRRIPRNCKHSVAWNIWHLARIEDVTMNLLVAGGPQVGSPQILNQDNWFERMKTTARDTGNAMDAEEVANLSAAIDIEALRAYRLAVGRRTREIVKQLQPEDLKQQVNPARLQQMLDEGAVVEAARGLLDYWGNRNIAGLLLMPATRHNLVHLNEALRLKQRRK